MIEINLLPEEFKKKESPFKKFDLSGLSLQNIPITNIAAILIGAFVVFHLLLFVIGMVNKIRFESLSKKYTVLLPKKKEADALKSEVAVMNRKTSAINELMVKRFVWAKKLNELSDSMTPAIWLSEVSYDEKTGEAVAKQARSSSGNNKVKSNPVVERSIYRYLVIGGYASSMGEQGTALIGKFIKSLKDNAQFYSDFSEIKLDAIKSDRFQDQEVMSFKITCLFKGST